MFTFLIRSTTQSLIVVPRPVRTLLSRSMLIWLWPLENVWPTSTSRALSRKPIRAIARRSICEEIYQANCTQSIRKSALPQARSGRRQASCSFVRSFPQDSARNSHFGCLAKSGLRVQALDSLYPPRTKRSLLHSREQKRCSRYVCKGNRFRNNR